MAPCMRSTSSTLVFTSQHPVTTQKHANSLLFHQLFESHAEPRLYWFGAKLYQKKDDGVWRFRAIERTSATCGVFKTEFEHFKNFFEIKTKYRWCDRVLKAGTGEKTDFSYTPPVRTAPSVMSHCFCIFSCSCYRPPYYGLNDLLTWQS